MYGCVDDVDMMMMTGVVIMEESSLLRKMEFDQLL